MRVRMSGLFTGERCAITRLVGSGKERPIRRNAAPQDSIAKTPASAVPNQSRPLM